jgi:hypothetical protein
MYDIKNVTDERNMAKYIHCSLLFETLPTDLHINRNVYKKEKDKLLAPPSGLPACCRI